MGRDDEDDLDFDLVRTSARDFLAGRGDKDSIGDLAAMDWLGLLVGEERGGVGWRPVEACLIAEELGRAHDRSPWFGCAVAAAAFADAPDPVRDHWLGAMLSGTTVAGFAPAGDVVRVIGGDRARAVVTAGPNGVHLVELSDTHTRWHDDDALDVARPVWCVDLTGLPAVSIGSAIQAQRLSAVGRLLVSADALGALSSALARLTAYLKDRIAFGAPIASFQAVQHRLVDLLVIEVKSRAIVAKAARTLASAHTADDVQVQTAVTQSAIAHAFVATKTAAAVDECMQLSGGIGFTWEYPLHHELRRAASDAVLVGTARSSRALLAEESGW
ncbi:MAG: acyl-CoA dehydrogenase family protein [Mycobacteriaceae bacterium]|nr:acyl-CoA dehydrogenase family protein [Mycobacteriaceae bacterium]